MRPQDPGPIQDVGVREKLKNEYGSVIEAGLRALDTAVRMNPQHERAMAYMNLLIRERAALRDTPEEQRRDIAVADDWLRKSVAAKKQIARGVQSVSIPIPIRVTIIGSVQESKLVNRTPPVYPALALQAKVSGTVHLQATIGKDGYVVDLRTIGGHSLLIPAAIEAVRHWVYQPTLIGGNPIEVVTDVDVNFLLP